MVTILYDLIISPGRSVVQMHLWRLDYRGEDVWPVSVVKKKKSCKIQPFSDLRFKSSCNNYSLARHWCTSTALRGVASISERGGSIRGRLNLSELIE